MGIGIALGGAAKGLESAEQTFARKRALDLQQQNILQDRDLRERALGIQERQLEQSSQNDLMTQVKGKIDEHEKFALGIIENARKSNAPLDKLGPLLEPILESVDTLGSTANVDTSGVRQRVGVALNAPVVEPSIGDPKDRAQTEAGLRKEFSSLAKPFLEVRDAHRRVLASAKNPSPAGDLALIFNYMKILDPGSTVREGEFANAQNSAGVPEQIRNMYNQVTKGTRLGEKTRADFVDRATGLFQAQRNQHGNLVNQFKGIAERLGIISENVTPDFSSVEPESEPDMPERTEGGMIPPEAVAFLKQNSNDPTVVQQFEAKYGQPAEAFLR